VKAKTNKHFVVFYTDPYYRKIADLVSAKLGGSYARDIRHGGDPGARRGEVLIGSRSEILYSFSHPLHQTQAAHTLVVLGFSSWASSVAESRPYATRDEWVEDMVAYVLGEVARHN
jgi:hypothetical protein